MSAIRAIETEYAGYRFRSRLEARWAVFFTLAGYRWEYEPEGFELPGGMRYLPDFRVRCAPPGMERVVWYEVKPEEVETDAKLNAFRCALVRQKAASIQVHQRTWYAPDAYLLAGDPLSYFDSHRPCPRCGVLSAEVVEAVEWRHTELGVPAVRVECLWCQWQLPEDAHWPMPIESGRLCTVRHYCGDVYAVAHDYCVAAARLINAAAAARAERFDRGASSQRATWAH